MKPKGPSGDGETAAGLSVVETKSCVTGTPSTWEHSPAPLHPTELPPLSCRATRRQSARPAWCSPRRWGHPTLQSSMVISCAVECSFTERQFHLQEGVFPTELRCLGIRPSLKPYTELPKVSGHFPSHQIHLWIKKKTNNRIECQRWKEFQPLVWLWKESSERTNILQHFILLQMPWQILSPWQTDI